MAAQPRAQSHGPTSRMLDAALGYAARGLPVFPLVERDKLPVIPKREGGEGYKDATTEEELLRRWWGRWPRANIGLPTGLRSGWDVVDIDPRHGGSLEALEAKYGALPPTLMARSGGGGLHVVFRHPEGHGPIRKLPAVEDKETGEWRGLGGLPGIDVETDGGYILVAPSLHPSGEEYRWLNDLAPAPLPDWLFEELVTKRERERERRLYPVPSPQPDVACDAPGDVLDGGDYWLRKAIERAPAGGDNAGYWLAQQLLLNDVADPAAVLRDYAWRATADPGDPFTDRDVARWLRSAAESDLVSTGTPARARPRGVAAPRPHLNGHARGVAVMDRSGYPGAPEGPEDDGGDAGDEPRQIGEGGRPRRKYARTEMGNSERLVERYGRNMAYCKAFGWCAFDGVRWVPDAELTVRRWAKATVRAIYDEASELSAGAAACEDQEERETLAEEAKRLTAWAIKSESDRMVGAVLSLARADCEVAVGAFDADPWLLNVANGTLDLRTGELRPHRREDYLMKLAPVTYDAGAEAPTFAAFVSQIMLGREELVAYIQRMLGYSLTGDVSEQVWHLLVGEGENGKSTLMDLVAHALGDYAGALEPESITVTGRPRDGGEASPDIAALKGRRFVTVTETEAGARIAAARIKKLCGGDPITARHLRRDPFTFWPTHKLFIYTNHVPQANETTHGFWRRVRYIPFEFRPTTKDPELPAKLRAELPGVLAWLVAGCLAWRREGLQPPKEVVEATEAYRDQMDVLGQFLHDSCLVREGLTARAGALWEAYKAWCAETGQRAITRTRLGLALKERGYEREHTRAGEVWHGLGLLADAATQATLGTSADARREESVKGVKGCEPLFAMTPSRESPRASSLEKPSQPFTPFTQGGISLSEEEEEERKEGNRNTETQKERKGDASSHAPSPRVRAGDSFVRRYEELVAGGMTPDEAVSQALRERGELPTVTAQTED